MTQSTTTCYYIFVNNHINQKITCFVEQNFQSRFIYFVYYWSFLVILGINIYYIRSHFWKLYLNDFCAILYITFRVFKRFYRRLNLIFGRFRTFYFNKILTNRTFSLAEIEIWKSKILMDFYSFHSLILKTSGIVILDLERIKSRRRNFSLHPIFCMCCQTIESRTFFSKIRQYLHLLSTDFPFISLRKFTWISYTYGTIW